VTYFNSNTICVQYTYNQTSYPYSYSPYYTGYNNTYSYSNSNNNNNNDDDDLRGDSAEIDNFELDEGDDTDLEEGDDEAEILDITFEVEDGDIRITRTEITFVFTGDSDAEDKPWEVFDRAYLLSDGDEIGEIDASDEDDWDEVDDDEYVLTFKNLREIIDEDDTSQLTLEVDVQSNIAEDEDTSWELFIADDGIRVIDGDNNSEEIGDEDQTVDISIEVD
jgi:hypothetical protein